MRDIVCLLANVTKIPRILLEYCFEVKPDLSGSCAWGSQV